MNLFDLIEDDYKSRVVADDTWRPEAPPDLSDVNDVIVNFETTGLKWFAGDLPISMSVYAKGRSWYLPFAHSGGGNLSEEQVYDFAQSLKSKHITNINTRFDAHMGRAWGDKLGRGGLNFEDMGCTLSDVSHYAALLDDHRRVMNLDSLITDFLQEKPMQRLDESRMQSYSAGAAQARARYNVEAVHRLKEVMWPRLDAEGLQKVRALEDKVIFVVLEMEKNGTRINMRLLEQWIKEAQAQFNKAVMDIYKACGMQINPNSPKDEARVFRHYNIPITELTATGLPSFSSETVKAIKHPTVQLMHRAKKLSSIVSKLKKYQKCVSSDNILRYALHQLRAAKSEGDEGGETGTVTGRFTSTEISPGIGVNIQQVMKPEKQFRAFGDEFFIRELHEAPPGQLFFSSDAEQIQYRLFAHEANNKKLIEAYSREDPNDPKTWISYHREMLKQLQVHKPDLAYGKCKDLNFAKMFNAGPTKLGLMMEFINKATYEQLKAQKANRYHPALASVLEILKIYDKEMPEVEQQNKKATGLAENRGYIKTILGRRLRFPMGPDGKRYRTHKALNGRIQGSEADIVKTKAVELHAIRKETGHTLCFQVHDEFDGYVPDVAASKRVSEVLNTQTFDLRVRILWGMKTGTSWGDCAKDELAKLRREAAK